MYKNDDGGDDNECLNTSMHAPTALAPVHVMIRCALQRVLTKPSERRYWCSSAATQLPQQLRCSPCRCWRGRGRRRVGGKRGEETNGAHVDKQLISLITHRRASVYVISGGTYRSPSALQTIRYQIYVMIISRPSDDKKDIFRVYTRSK